MREQFDVELAGLRQDLVKAYAEVDLALHWAVSSLVKGDREVARKARRSNRKVSHSLMGLEERAYNLIVLQNPVASDLRLLQFIIFVNFNLQRICTYVRSIAHTTDRVVGHEVPGFLMDRFASLAHLVYAVMGSTVKAIVENDLAAATGLPELHEPVEDLYHTFFKVFAKMGPTDDVDSASRVVMAARNLERISDISMEVGERLVFLLTGRRESLDDLADMDEEELEEIQAAQSVGFTMGQKELVRAANEIPEVEMAMPRPATGTGPANDAGPAAGADTALIGSNSISVCA